MLRVKYACKQQYKILKIKQPAEAVILTIISLPSKGMFASMNCDSAPNIPKIYDTRFTVPSNIDEICLYFSELIRKDKKALNEMPIENIIRFGSVCESSFGNKSLDGSVFLVFK